LMQSKLIASDATISGQLEQIWHEPFGTELVLQLAPLLRVIISSGQEQEYLRQLYNLQVRKELEIESACSSNYQAFIESTNRLLNVRSGTTSLRHRVGELNDEIQSKGEDMANKVLLRLLYGSALLTYYRNVQCLKTEESVIISRMVWLQSKPVCRFWMCQPRLLCWYKANDTTQLYVWCEILSACSCQEFCRYLSSGIYHRQSQ